MLALGGDNAVTGSDAVAGYDAVSVAVPWGGTTRVSVKSVASDFPVTVSGPPVTGMSPPEASRKVTVSPV